MTSTLPTFLGHFRRICCFATIAADFQEVAPGADTVLRGRFEILEREAVRRAELQTCNTANKHRHADL